MNTSDTSSTILIIGQGYAGSLLAWLLIEKGFRVSVVDSWNEFSSTKVAAGIMLPVTGRRLAKTHLADRLLRYAAQTYRKIEQVTSSAFFYEKPVLQVFSSINNLNEWYARSSEPEMKNYCGNILSTSSIDHSIVNDYGGILLNQCGYVDSVKFVEGVRNFIHANGNYIEETFLFNDMTLLDNSINWKGNNYSKVIFCEGYHTLQNPYFNYLPFKPAKGEILDFYATDLSEEYIISNSVYVLPLGNFHFRVGATYEWNDLTEQTTDDAFLFLTDHLKKTIKCDFEITGHKAGVRPAIRDRRPLIGLHPKYSRLGIFNGLGTKGAMLGPYYANQLVLLLAENSKPDRDVDISRFESLYEIS